MTAAAHIWRRRVAVVALATLAGAVGLLVAEPQVGAASFTVTSTADTPDAAPGDGACADAGGACSLRAAIAEANALPGADVVNLPSGTFAVGTAGASEDANATGDFDVAPADGAGLTINGNGAGQTVVDGGGLDRVFHVVSGSASITGLTIQGGTADRGGGIYVAVGASLTLDTVRLRANTAAEGSALRNAGTASVSRTLFDGNGGAGAAVTGAAGTVSLVNSTVSGNTGEGVESSAGASVNLVHVTIAGNGGPGVSVPGGTVTLRNSVVSGNGGAQCSPSGAVGTEGFNVVSDASCSPGPADRAGTDPRLGALVGNGGPTPTHLPQPGSPVVDYVADGACPVADDQRGAGRPRDGDADGVARCDAGAVEVADGQAATTTSTRPGGSLPTVPPARPVSGRPATVG